MSDSTVVSVEPQPDKIVVRLHLDHLDETNIDQMRKNVDEAASAAPQLPVILDMAKVAFLVSLSLGEFVGLVQQFKSRGQRLVLANLQPPVRQVFAVTRLDKLFEIQDAPISPP
jgi:anti-sigma B factor antagonist